MTSGTFTKMFPSREAVCQAVAHHAWLSEQVQPFRLPPILAVHLASIDFGFIDGRHAEVSDTLTVAGVLGHGHAAAWASDLHRALLNHPHPLAGGRFLTDFVALRLAALQRRERDGYASPQEVAAVLPLLRPHPETPVAFYKDTNPRNVLIGPDGPVMVDVDDAITVTISAGSALLSHCVINVGGGGQTALHDVVEHVRQLTAGQISIRSEDARSGDVATTCADTSAARRLLGWAPSTTLLKGLREQLNWMASRRSPSVAPV